MICTRTETLALFAAAMTALTSVSETASAQQPMFVRADALVPSPLPQLLAVGDFNGDGMDDFLGAQPCFSVGSGLYAASGTGPPLAAATNDAELSNHVVVADFTGDGTLDVIQLVAVPPGSSGTYQYSYVGGGATPPTNAFPSNIFGGTIGAGDVDGDGDVDIVASPLRFASIGAYSGVLFNTGTGAFVAQNGWLGLSLGDFSRRLVVEDLDGDGNADVVGEKYGLGPTYAQRSWGNGAFDVPYVLTPPGSTTLGSAVVGDVDGDGRKDVLYTYVAQSVTYAAIARLLPTTTWFTFAPPVVWPIANPETYPASDAGYSVMIPKALVDLDMDGDAEIVVSTAAGVEIRDFVGGTVTAPSAVLPVWPGALTPFDADQNGRTDLASLWMRTNSSVTLRRSEVGVLFNNGVGGLDHVSGTSTPRRNSSWKAVFADADGDGDSDLVAYAPTTSGGAPAIGTNDGRGMFTWEPSAACVGCPAAQYGLWPTGNYGAFPGAVLDGDADGDVDILMYTIAGGGSNATDAVVYLRNDGPAGFTTTTTHSMPGRNFTSTADFNSDGFIDAATASTSSIYVQFGGPAGLGAPTIVVPSSGTGLAAVDVDVDGDADLLRWSTIGGAPAIVAELNDGAGQFVPMPLTISGAFQTNGEILAGDVDGDGLKDLLAGDSWLRRTGPLTFVGQGSVSGIATYLAASRFCYGDFDSDGDLDALTNGGQLFLNAGTGTFATAPVAATGSLLPNLAAPAVADVDGDGDLDLAEADGVVLTNTTRQLAAGRPLRPDRPFDVRLYGQPNAWWTVATALDALPAPIEFAPFGRLELDPLTAVSVASGTLDANGRAELVGSLDASTAAIFAGVPFVAQAVVDDGGVLRLTNGRRFVVALY